MIISASHMREDGFMNRSKLGVIAVVTLLLLSFSLQVVLVRQSSQYTTSKTTDVTIGSTGTFNASEPAAGISYQIVGTPDATGTVTSTVYTGNPQPTADVPSGISLTSFVIVTIYMNVNDFSSATITLNYTNAMVQNIKPPYSVYKYDTKDNSYVELPSTVKTLAQRQ